MFLVISNFGFEGGTLVLIASVPGHCLSFTRHVFFYLTYLSITLPVEVDPVGFKITCNLLLCHSDSQVFKFSVLHTQVYLHVLRHLSPQTVCFRAVFLTSLLFYLIRKV